MRAFRSSAARGHDPDRYFRRGQLIDHPETVRRLDVLEMAAVEAGLVLLDPPGDGAETLGTVHNAAYLDFLRTAWTRRSELGGEVDELLTTQFPYARHGAPSASLAAALGRFLSDTSTPIRAGTWDAVHSAAQAAIAAADAALTDGMAYALCRPPGHHAYPDCASGFCYLNNAAAAAQRLRERLPRVGILDIDVHHGNGTQAIFYAREDVAFASVHADPTAFFPLYAGFADEIGEGDGLGANLNLPLAPGSGDRRFLDAIDRAIAMLIARDSAGFVVSLGLDAHESDPYGVLRVTADGFAKAAERIAALPGPVALVQEGGYPSPHLGGNLITFLQAFRGGRRSLSPAR